MVERRKRLRSSVKSGHLHHHSLCRCSFVAQVFPPRMISFLLVFKDGKGREKNRSGLQCWALLGTQHHLLRSPTSNSLSALPNCLTGKILAQYDWNMFPQKMAALWKEVCAVRCLEEPGEVLVEVLDDKVSKLVKRVERLVE